MIEDAGDFYGLVETMDQNLKKFLRQKRDPFLF